MNFCQAIIRPTLQYLGLWSTQAEQQVWARAAPILVPNVYNLTAREVDMALDKIAEYDGLSTKVRRLATALYAEDPDGEHVRNPVFATAIVRVGLPLTLEADDV